MIEVLLVVGESLSRYTAHLPIDEATHCCPQFTPIVAAQVRDLVVADDSTADEERHAQGTKSGLRRPNLALRVLSMRRIWD